MGGCVSASSSDPQPPGWWSIVTVETRLCAFCRAPFVARSHNQRYCCSAHTYQARRRDERELYGQSKRLRRRLMPTVATGTVRCARGAACSFAVVVGGRLVGGLIQPGQRWDLGHPDAESVGGPEHAHCNRAAPARLRASGAKPRTSREWF